MSIGFFDLCSAASFAVPYLAELARRLGVLRFAEIFTNLLTLKRKIVDYERIRNILENL